MEFFRAERNMRRPCEVHDRRRHGCGREQRKPTRQHDGRGTALQLQFSAGDEHYIEAVRRLNALYETRIEQLGPCAIEYSQEVERDRIWVYEAFHAHDDRAQRKVDALLPQALRELVTAVLGGDPIEAEHTAAVARPPSHFVYDIPWLHHTTPMLGERRPPADPGFAPSRRRSHRYTTGNSPAWRCAASRSPPAADLEREDS